MQYPDPPSAGQLIATSEARTACKDEPDLTERIRKAMRACHNHWMEQEESRRFKAALAAAYLESPQEDRAVLVRSAGLVGKMNAYMVAVQACIEAEPPEPPPEGEYIIPLLGLWHETKADKR